MQVIVTCFLLFYIIAGSDGRLTRGPDKQSAVEISLKDLAEAENPINLRAYSGICDVNYVKIGCFKDKKNSRALSQELFQDREPKDPNYSGQAVNWGDYSTYLKGLACRCAQNSQQKGFTYFGLQDYARCFSDPHASSSYNKYGTSKKCSNQHYQTCDDNAWGECVGKKDVSYVYKIEEASSGDGKSYGLNEETDGEAQNS